MASAQTSEAPTIEQAQEIMDRFDDLGMGEEVTEADLIGTSASRAIRETCAQLAAAVLAAAPAAPPAGGVAGVEAAAEDVRDAAANQADANGEQLDGALRHLAVSVDAEPVARHRIYAVEALIAYVQAVRLVALAAAGKSTDGGDAEMTDAPAPASAAGQQIAAMDLDDDSADVSAQLHALAAALKVDAAGKSAADVVAEMSRRADELLEALPASLSQPLLRRSAFSEDQMKMIDEIDQGLRSEHMLRRRMLIERVKVTLQSFLWSKRLKERGTEAEAAEVAARGEAALEAAPSIKLDDIFTLTQADLVAMGAKVTSGAGGGLRASVKGVLIGAVPDRGGRAEGREAQALANMPAFAARKAGAGGGGRSGGRGGRGGNRGAGAGRGGRGGGGGGGKRHKGAH